jgi:thiamine monophosphate kinase
VRTALSACAVAGTRIGRIIEGQGVRLRDDKGEDWRPAHAGFDHFNASITPTHGGDAA